MPARDFAARWARDERGQAFPVYITVIGALLFLAFACFAVAQAAATRNGAQTAADAAALAAAQDSGTQLRDLLIADIGSGRTDAVPGLLAGNLPGPAGPSDDPCGQASRFAAANHAHITGCRPAGLDGYAVSVETDEPVGASVIPGTRHRRAQASASAALTPLCQWRGTGPSASPALPDGTPAAGPTPPAAGTGTGAGPGPAAGALVCRSGTYSAGPGRFPAAAELFDVHLTG